MLGEEESADNDREIVSNRREGEIAVLLCGVLDALEDAAEAEKYWTDEHDLRELGGEFDLLGAEAGYKKRNKEWGC